MEFLNIPVEVIDKSILPYLGWNDLLRLRRVCKTTKDVVDGFIKDNPDLAPEIEINEDDKSFGALLGMKIPIPVTKVFLNNVSPRQEIYKLDERNVSLFLQKFGASVKHLRVHQISYHPYGKEWDFLEKLVNLQSFEAGCYGYGKTFEEVTQGRIVNFTHIHIAQLEMLKRASKDPRFRMTSVPDTFKNLKSLKIGQQVMAELKNSNMKAACLLDVCRELEYFMPPYGDECDQLPSLECLSVCFLWMRTAIDANIENRDKAFFSPNLKVINLHNLNPRIISFGENKHGIFEYNSSANFLELCAACVKKDAKLENVNAVWFQRRVIDLPQQLRSPDLGLPVLSLINLHPGIYSLNMENLERVQVRTSVSNVEGNRSVVDWKAERPDWPNLKYLDIKIDSKDTMGICFINGEPVGIYPGTTKNVFNFLFQEVSRTKLVELCLRFQERLIDNGPAPVPKMEHILTACPNLKKLTIVNWKGTNKALIKLFEGLKGLEEIELESCKDLGNVAFVGLDTRNPVFFKLTKLKKLSLKSLDQMPKITDLLFDMVIRHLKLTHLTLTSGSSIKSVTSAGILSLLDGGFAETIEKFCFQNWSLANVSKKEFKKMEKKFRSHYMI